MARTYMPLIEFLKGGDEWEVEKWGRVRGKNMTAWTEKKPIVLYSLLNMDVTVHNQSKDNSSGVLFS